MVFVLFCADAGSAPFAKALRPVSLRVPTTERFLPSSVMACSTLETPAERLRDGRY